MGIFGCFFGHDWDDLAGFEGWKASINAKCTRCGTKYVDTDEYKEKKKRIDAYLSSGRPPHKGLDN